MAKNSVFDHFKIKVDEVNNAFGSDNMAGMHQGVLDAIGEANEGYKSPYQNDDVSAQTFEILLNALGVCTFF
jgi:threonine aldolase